MRLTLVKATVDDVDVGFKSFVIDVFVCVFAEVPGRFVVGGMSGFRVELGAVAGLGVGDIVVPEMPGCPADDTEEGLGMMVGNKRIGLHSPKP